MDTARAFPSPSTDARNFALRGAAWGLGLFGVLRLSWVEAHAILPLTSLQGRIAATGFGPPALPVDVTLACSGADAFALCAAAILAYPVSWRMRLAGASVGIALILCLNTVRIGTLGLAAGSSSFGVLHVYVWPALLALAIAGYVFGWMRFTDVHRAIAAAPARPRARPSRRFVVLTAAFLVMFVGASPLYLESSGMFAVASFIARAAAAMLRLLGVQAGATSNVLSTPLGGFVVTPECISTPLIAVYLAAVVAYARSWRGRALALLAAGPLFVGLGIARLLVVALPATLVGSPLFLIHAFYQLLLAAVVVFAAACWRHGTGATARRRTLWGGILAGAIMCLLARPLDAHALAWTFAGAAPLGDPQGAIAFLPAFQLGLFVALYVAAFSPVRWRPLLAGVAVLGFLQVIVFTALHGIAGSTGLLPHVREIRAWALAGPVLVIAGMVALHRRSQKRAAGGPARAYLRFWARVGERFPDLGGAASTRYYAENERRLFTEHFPPLAGLKILKTDLWDEAKNTRILAWASEQGAHAYGIDISEPTLNQARTAFHREPLRSAVADVRDLPFRDGCFDAIYSMGTIEHFDETEHAVGEIARVLMPGGRAIVGVPNRHDPFLRPLLAAGLQAMGLYGYGFEKSYSRRTLREMLERAGLVVTAETAILFMPGWLRMLDLACHSWCPPFAKVTGVCVWPFVLLDRYVPVVRHHGYLLATVVTKPATD
jgi:exosortase/archaeosortase family protein